MEATRNMDDNVVLYHGSREIEATPEIRVGRYQKDFSIGFYCTALQEQARRWATRFPGRGYVNMYEYRPRPNLQTLVFPEMTEEWLDFIVASRLGRRHEYDSVEGPVANDVIFNYVQNFVDGKISREAFWALVKFKRPTHQICLCTSRALESLCFINATEVISEK